MISTSSRVGLSSRFEFVDMVVLSIMSAVAFFIKLALQELSCGFSFSFFFTVLLFFFNNQITDLSRVLKIPLYVLSHPEGKKVKSGVHYQ